MRIRVVTGDILELRIKDHDGRYLDNHEENKLYEFLLARQMERATAPKDVNLVTRHTI